MIEISKRLESCLASVKWATFFGTLLLILFGLYKAYTLPATTPGSRAVSPDGRTVISVDEKLYGIGNQFYVIRIGPSGALLNWVFGKDVIEVDDVGNTPPPVASWADKNTVVIGLPVNGGKLADVVRRGFVSGPALDHYRSVRIIYHAL